VVVSLVALIQNTQREKKKRGEEEECYGESNMEVSTPPAQVVID
jgi:hypothetical protein